MAIVIAVGPEVVDADPHGTKEFSEPLSLCVCHFYVVAVAVLGLEVAPVFREFTAEQVVPTNCLLLFE